MSQEEENEPKGLLSMIGDPLGKVLDTTLKPTLGAITGKVGEPTGDALKRVQNVARYEKGYSTEDNDLTDKERPGGERIGGKKADAENPLGL